MDSGLALTLLGIGGSFLLVACILAIIMINRKRKCTASTEGVVVDFKVVSDENTHSYHPVYEYRAAGVKYRRTGAAFSGRTPGINTVVPVMYNPDKPRQSYIPGYDNKVYKILIIVFALIGCIPVAVCVCIALFS